MRERAGMTSRTKLTLYSSFWPEVFTGTATDFPSSVKTISSRGTSFAMRLRIGAQNLHRVTQSGRDTGNQSRIFGFVPETEPKVIDRVNCVVMEDPKRAPAQIRLVHDAFLPQQLTQSE